MRPQAAHSDEISQFPRESRRQAWALGLLNLTIPEAAGGLGQPQGLTIGKHEDKMG